MADLTYRDVDIHRGPCGGPVPPISVIHLDLWSGFDDEAEVRGEDRIVPQAAGRYIRPRQKDRRRIELRGYVWGFTVDDYRDLVEELHDIFDPTLEPGPLVIRTGYLGADATYAINARYLNAMWGAPGHGGRFRPVSVELESVDSPPDWEPIGS